MSKTVKKVFIIIGVLVLCLIIWTVVFNDNGIMVTAYNAMADAVNGAFESIAGKGKKVMPTWKETDSENTNGNATDSTKTDGGTGTH